MEAPTSSCTIYNRKELVHGFRGMGIVVSLKVVEKLFLAMDRDGSGTLSIEELYLGMRGAMNLTRVKLINKLHEDLVKRSAPNSMPERDDSVPVGFLVEEWNGDHFDDVKSRRRRFEDVRDLYFAQLDGDLVAPKNGFITRTKMLDFYQDLTEAFVGDGSGGDPEGNDQFAFFVRATWNFWDMRGFEAPRKESSRGALHKGRDDSNADDNDDDFGAGADGFDLPGRQQQQQQRPQTAESEASDASGSGRRRPGGSSKQQVAGRRRDPVPWEANHSWSHADMRSSLSAQPHVPMPRVGSAAAAALGMSSAAAEAAANSGLTVSDLGGLPAAVFGDLSSLVHGNGRARDSSAAAKLILPKHDCWDEMRRLFFEPPPGAFQDFCERLKLSKVDESPPIASSSLASRVFELGKKRALAAQKAGHGGGGQHRFAQRDADAIASAVFREAQRSNWPTNRRDSGGNGDDNASEAESEFSAGSSSWAGSSVASGARGGRGQQNFPVAAEKEGALVPARWLFDRLVTLFGASAAEKKRRQVSVLDRVRNMLVDQCGPLGLGELRKQLTLMDLDGSLTLDEDELKKGFGLMGLYLNNREVEQVFWEFDRDKDGTVDYDEFMDGIRGGPMSHDRRKLVKQAWRHVTRGGGGSAVLDVDVLMQAFNCLWYPSVASRAADPARVVEAVHKRFCDGDNGGGNQQTVDFHAFLQYHWDVSASVEGDRMFDAVVRNTWQFSS
jgi:Ca2+-binding EF-hand superfamily protein